MAEELPGNGCSVQCPSGQVLGEEITAPEAAAPAAVVADTTPSGALPFTGGDVAGLVVVGTVALGAGTVMVRRTRTRTQTAA
jgi:hypothetical protein